MSTTTTCEHAGRDVAGVIEQYTRFVKPSHDEFIAPSRRTADIVIPWQRGENLVAVDLVVGHLRSHIVSDVLLSKHPNLHLLESTFQMRGMHTIVRDRDTKKGEFIFMADRLIRLVRSTSALHLRWHFLGMQADAASCGATAAILPPASSFADISPRIFASSIWMPQQASFMCGVVSKAFARHKKLQVVEHALGLLPTTPVAIRTPTDATYAGSRVSAAVCGVSVIRSGEAMESALRSCWKGIDIGKILVQRRHHHYHPRGSGGAHGGASSSGGNGRPSVGGDREEGAKASSAGMSRQGSRLHKRTGSGAELAAGARHASGPLPARSPLPFAQDSHGSYYNSNACALSTCRQQPPRH
jgi:uracil phosphoribosyltransferase